MTDQSGPARFRTERLSADRIERHHLAELLAMNGDPATMAALGGIRSEHETAAYLEQSLLHWTSHGFGIWIIRLYESGAFAGRAGLRHAQIGEAAEVEIAYALQKDKWGRGLATEIGKALVWMGFRSLGLKSIVSITRPDNRSSRRVMEKIGLRYERSFDHQGKPSVIYRVNKDEYITSTP